MYESLYKIYYKNMDIHEQTYHERYNAPSSVHIPVRIRQFNHEHEYPAFFCYSPEVVLSLEKVNEEFTEFLKILFKVTPLMLNQFAMSCIVDEVHSTSEIEGIHSTYRELRDILDGGRDNKHFSSIIRMYELLLSGEYQQFKTCEDVRNFYDEFCHLDAIANNPHNRLDGEIFRKEAVDVKTSTGKIIHRGLEPESEIISSMSEALKFLNSDEHPFLVRIALFHYLFVYIHPFYDGNGRTARFISSSYLAKKLHSLVGLRLSVTLKKNKTKYYRLLNETDAEINCGDITPFLEGFINFVSETLREINRKLERKIIQFERLKQKLLSVLPPDEDIQNIVSCILQSSVFYGRGATMTELMRSCDKARNTIKSKLQKIPVREKTLRRKKFYKADWPALRRLVKEAGHKGTLSDRVD